MEVSTVKEKTNENSWYAQKREVVVQEFRSSVDQGLTSADAEQRLHQVGLNQLEETPPPTFWQMLWEQLNSFVVILLMIAAVISALLGDWVEAVVIGAIVVLNTALGVIQERRAEQALAALQKLAAPEAHVIRDGHRTTIPSPQLVPGDLVLLEAGNLVPADIRLLETMNLRIDESALTGESIAAQKDAAVDLVQDIPLGDQKNTAFMGTIVNYGRGKGLVVSTGMNTQIGLIARMLQSVDREQTPLQRRLDQLGKTLGKAALAICAVVFIVGLLRGNAPLDMFMIAVGLAIAAVPEGLPAVVTISLALGMQEMIKRHALIRRLSSVETLGSATVICSDKTGTLTQNVMTATHLWVDGTDIDITGDGFQVQGRDVNLAQYPGALTTLWVAGLNNDGELEKVSSDNGRTSSRLIGDPTETAMLVAAIKAGVDLDDLNRAYPRVQEVPFDATRKRMVTIHSLAQPRKQDPSPFAEEHQESGFAVLVKGAPDVVLNLCSAYQKADDTIAPLTEAERARILEANEAMTGLALRVLGQAYRVAREQPDVENVDLLESDLVFAGLVGMIDPPRKEVAPALATATKAGIRTIMITGDYSRTAGAIGKAVGLLRPGHQVLTGPELNQIDDEGLKEEVRRTDVFARVSPEHKMRIVEALQANGEVVAMTGDGVNDAPAIKRADIGVAMGISGTDVAKGSADMVLTDDNYASIVSAVEQGRVIYNNIRKFVFFLISSNLAEIMIIFLATLAGIPMPLTVIQLLWLNLITDGAPALALAMEKGDPDVMNQQPRGVHEPIINRSMRLGLIIQTVVQTVAVLGAFFLGLIWHLEGAGIPAGMNPIAFVLQYDWEGIDVMTAETMAFVTLSLAELFRAYTVRSERASLFKIGIFSNRYMQYAVALSVILLLLVVNVPFLQPVFNTHFLNLNEWLLVIGLGLLPAIAEEITKIYLRWQDRKPAAA